MNILLLATRFGATGPTADIDWDGRLDMLITE